MRMQHACCVYPKASDIAPPFRSWSPQAETKILELEKQLADSQLEVQALTTAARQALAEQDEIEEAGLKLAEEAVASATAEADAKAKVTCI